MDETLSWSDSHLGSRIRAFRTGSLDDISREDQEYPRLAANSLDHAISLPNTVLASTMSKGDMKVGADKVKFDPYGLDASSGKNKWAE